MTSTNNWINLITRRHDGSMQVETMEAGSVLETVGTYRRRRYGSAREIGEHRRKEALRDPQIKSAELVIATRDPMAHKKRQHPSEANEALAAEEKSEGRSTSSGGFWRKH